MKAMQWLLILLVLLAGQAAVQAIVIENPSFEADGILDPGPAVPSGWTWNNTGNLGVYDSTGNSTLPSDGNHYLWLGNGCVIFQTTDHIIPAAGVSYTAAVDAHNSWRGSPMITAFYDDGGTRVELGRAWIDGSGVDSWSASATVELTFTSTAASVGKPLGVTLTHQNAGNYWVHFDNVRLNVNTVVLHNPANGAQFVSLNPTLTWSTAGTVEYIDLYFGLVDDPNLTADPYGLGHKKLDLVSATTTSYQPGPLAHETTYYWKVVAYEPNEQGGYIATAGDAFHFTTTGPNPYLTAQPRPQTAPGDGSQSVSLSVDGTEIAHYAWYRTGEATPLPDNAKYDGVSTAALIINNVTLADEGLYYCKVWNDQSPLVVDSQPAVVITERLAGWWKFENNLDDSVSEIVGGATAHPGQSADPNYTDGIDGLAKRFSLNAEPVIIPGSGDFFNFYINGYTVSAWVRTTAPGENWTAMVNKENGAAGEGFALAADPGSGNAVHILRGASYNGDGNQYGATPVNDDQWHQVIGTCDADTGVTRIYVDGRLEAENTNTNAPAVNPNALVFGAWGGETFSAYDGDLDDVRIWSYPLTEREAAILYTDLVPTDPRCVPAPAFDISGPAGEPDCRVDLYDLAALAGEWLACNLLPVDLCP